MKKNLKEKLHYESKFEYSKGIIRTPEKWKNYFWAAYYKKILSSLRSKITKYNRVVFIGIGYGDMVPSLQFEDRIKIIGIDVNFNSLLSAKEHTSVIMADGSC